MASAPAGPTSSSGRSVPLATRSSAGKRAVEASAASNAMTVVSPPSGSLATATIVSEPPSRIARAAASALRATGGWAPSRPSIEHDRVAAAGRDALGGLDRALDRLALRVGRCAERDRRHRLDAGRRPVADLLRAHARQDDAQLDPLDALQRDGEATQRLGLARAGGADDRRARAAADRGQPLDRLQRRVVGARARSARAGTRTGRSSKCVPSATSSAGRPLIVSTRTSDG